MGCEIVKVTLQCKSQFATVIHARHATGHRSVRARLSRPIVLLGLDAVERRDQRVNTLVCVVKRERRAHGRLQAEPAQDRLRAMMTGTDRDAFAVERGADVLGSAAMQNSPVRRGLLLSRRCIEEGVRQFGDQSGVDHGGRLAPIGGLAVW